MRKPGPEQIPFEFTEGGKAEKDKKKKEKGKYTTPSGESLEWEDTPTGRVYKRRDASGRPIENEREDPWQDLGKP